MSIHSIVLLFICLCPILFPLSLFVAEYFFHSPHNLPTHCPLLCLVLPTYHPFLCRTTLLQQVSKSSLSPLFVYSSHPYFALLTSFFLWLPSICDVNGIKKHCRSNWEELLSIFSNVLLFWHVVEWCAIHKTTQCIVIDKLIFDSELQNEDRKSVW